MRLLCFFLLCAFGLSGQTYFHYATDADGQRRHLARTETFDGEQLTSKVIYRPDGRPTTRYRYAYDARGNRTEEVMSNIIDHEWDIIRRNEYDEQDRLVRQLRGNNYNGKWGYIDYHYNERGDLARMDHFLKSGPLYKQSIYTYTYDERGRKTSEQAKDVAIDGRLITTGVRFDHTYLPDGVRTTHTDSTGQRYLTETKRYRNDGQLTSHTQQFADGGTLKTSYRYDGNGRLTSTRTSYNGTSTGGTVVRREPYERLVRVTAPDGVGEIYLPPGISLP